ncbi:M15 family metallopeptidase [Nocardioides mesophilus]|uniref:M15 family metallopeptidase n=1 Tax=Nocardioides mesophilus TaxID=433659 RepID=A0A7G9RFW1_9ACTN|nr:M15 family metallopeptidase [Nocardioides mesophilus]QNN54486.1 M15 family metallopeptidase [Nocardioides mesophilus]
MRAAAAVVVLLPVLAACAGQSAQGRDEPVVRLSIGAGSSSVAPSESPAAPPASSEAGSATAGPTAPSSGSSSPDPSSDPAAQAAADAAAYSMPDPGPLHQRPLTADVLVTSAEPIPAATARRIRALHGVDAAMPLSVASLSSNGRTLTIAAVDPGQFRRFTPEQSARADEVWSRVAGGEVAVDPSIGKKLEEPAGFLQLGTQQDAPEVHIGAYAPLVRRISAVVAEPRAEQFGMVPHNALLVSTGRFTPSAVTPRIQKVLGSTATLQVLALEFDVDVPQTAVLTGTSAAEAVGSFSYTPLADGRVVPDPGWVAANIRTESVPLIGSVTCHRVMIPQLRAALEEVVQRGLAAQIHPDEYAGCYYPRFIGYDPAKGLSLHSWGIAVDLNTPGNQRGTAGEMNRQVVAIFKKWGFAWGGDWNYTDPMHFELATIVRTG